MKYSEAREIAAGLREAADLIETMGVKLGEAPYITISTSIWDDSHRSLTPKQLLANIARTVPGKLDKEHNSHSFELTKKFSGGIKWHWSTPRSNVCLKVVTGTREVPKYEAVGTKTEEIVEWICTEPLLR